MVTFSLSYGDIVEYAFDAYLIIVAYLCWRQKKEAERREESSSATYQAMIEALKNREVPQ